MTSPPLEDQVPAVDDLSALSIAELEAMKKDLRQRLAKNHTDLLSTVGWAGHGGGSGRIQGMMEASANRLLTRQSALRDNLEAVEAELRERREVAQMERERRILDSTRWATWAAAIAALVSAFATGAQLWRGASSNNHPTTAQVDSRGSEPQRAAGP